jgi:hypothetical protein
MVRAFDPGIGVRGSLRRDVFVDDSDSAVSGLYGVPDVGLRLRGRPSVSQDSVQTGYDAIPRQPWRPTHSRVVQDRQQRVYSRTAVAGQDPLLLQPCQSSGVIRARVSRSSGSANFNEGNDYSYLNTASFVDRTQITLLKGTQVFWGVPGP